METLYVLEPGAYLRKEAGCLSIVKDRQVIETIPLEGLKRLLLVGRASLTGAVLDVLIQNRVETVFITAGGRYRGRLAVDEHGHVELRRSQYLRLSDPLFNLRAAQVVVKGKIVNMQRFLSLRARQNGSDVLRYAAVRLKAMAATVPSTQNTDQVRGIEGAATAVYYKVFAEMLTNPQFVFKHRSRRPPLDPVNALLSFVYTLMTNEVLSAIKTCGLDPFLGALHEVSYGRPSLACDLVEEYRCFLGDRLVLGLLNRRAIGPEDFVIRADPPAEFTDEAEMRAKRPVEMKPAVCRSFIAAYEKMMQGQLHYKPLGRNVSYRMLLLHQVRRYADWLQDEAKVYQPFAWES
jgi:CRISPR-associated protein Cas1